MKPSAEYPDYDVLPYDAVLGWYSYLEICRKVALFELVVIARKFSIQRIGLTLVYCLITKITWVLYYTAPVHEYYCRVSHPANNLPQWKSMFTYLG